MTKFRMSNVSRHRRTDTLEWFYNEWHGEHVEIMRRSPGVMKLVRRYVQNRALHDESLPNPPLPLAPEGWDAMSQLTFDSCQAFIDTFGDADYIANVRGHLLSDPSTVVTVLTEDETVIDGIVNDPAVKAVLFYQLRETESQEDFETQWVNGFARDLTEGQPILRHVRNRVTGVVDSNVFKETRWDGVVMNEFTAYDELWFENRSALRDFLTDPRVGNAVDSLNQAFLTSRSFTYLCREIVQIDSLETAFGWQVPN